MSSGNYQEYWPDRETVEEKPAKKIKTKAFKIDGDDFADLCHWQQLGGKLVVDVMGNTITPGQARKLSAWLKDAADEVEQYNRSLKRKSR